jgi:hypothetical protein
MSLILVLGVVRFLLYVGSMARRGGLNMGLLFSF